MFKKTINRMLENARIKNCNSKLWQTQFKVINNRKYEKKKSIQRQIKSHFADRQRQNNGCKKESREVKKVIKRK